MYLTRAPHKHSDSTVCCSHTHTHTSKHTQNNTTLKTDNTTTPHPPLQIKKICLGPISHSPLTPSLLAMSQRLNPSHFLSLQKHRYRSQREGEQGRKERWEGKRMLKKHMRGDSRTWQHVTTRIRMDRYLRSKSSYKPYSPHILT